MTPWDHVIVGAGSAGCALAARLSEDPRRRVLLIEAGGEGRSPVIAIPAGVVRAIGNPRFDWGHLAEPDPSRGNKVDLWPAGKLLGGSSAINGMLFVRGARADFDAWEALGNSGWGWEGVASAFRRMETYDGAGRDRGAAGPQHVQRLRSTHPLAAAFIAAAEAAGLPRNPDYNGAMQEGVSAPQVTQKRGARWSAARAYLDRARRRPNLRIVTGALVQRVLLEDGAATGVLYAQGGRTHVAQAREAILAAGALGSPKLLMLSGIGPPDELRRHGIPVVLAHRAVGQNLTEHPNANMSWDVRARTYNVEVNGWRMPLHLANWLLFRRGPATSPYPHAVAFYRSSPELDAPDIQLMFGPFAFSFTPEGVTPYRRPAVTVVAALNRPRARGHISLRSPDPADPPHIHHALLSDLNDVARLIQACRFVREIFRQPPLARQIVRERLPGPAVQSDGEWEAYLRQTTFLGYHPCGTCRMAPDGVVDNELRVRGVRGLRVADASIMPLPVSGNTNAASMMIGERAAELIRGRG